MFPITYRVLVVCVFQGLEATTSSAVFSRYFDPRTCTVSAHRPNSCMISETCHFVEQRKCGKKLGSNSESLPQAFCDPSITPLASNHATFHLRKWQGEPMMKSSSPTQTIHKGLMNVLVPCPFLTY